MVTIIELYMQIPVFTRCFHGLDVYTFELSRCFSRDEKGKERRRRREGRMNNIFLNISMCQALC